MAEQSRMRCPRCGAEMNYHADKVHYTTGLEQPQEIDPALGGVVQQVHQCPNCGNIEMRTAD